MEEPTKPKSNRPKDNFSSCNSIILTIGFFILGFINNLGFTFVLTCSQQFSEKLKNPSLIALYPIAEMGFSSFARVINSKYCIKVSYMIRVIAISIYFFIGFISLYFILHVVEVYDDINTTLAFCLTLIPSIIMGTGGAFGEASILGYLRLYPEDYVAAWSSGTGFSGVGGASITLIFKLQEIKTKKLYLYMSPVCSLYFISYFILDKVYQSRKQVTENENENEPNQEQRVVSHLNDTSEEPLQGEVIKVDQNTDVKQNKEMSFANFKEGFSKGKRYILNLALVYYLEYIILAGFADRISIRGHIKDEPYFSKHVVYETLSLCYQIGVLISRSSLIIVKLVPYVEVFTICQAVNFIMWFIEVYFNYVYYGYILFFHMMIVGLMGGASYVGCFYYILNNQEISFTLRELCINIGTIFNDIGILSASATVLLFDNTIM